MSLTLNGDPILRNATGNVHSGTLAAIVSSEPLGAVALMETLSNRGRASRYKHLYKLEVRVNGVLVDTHQHSYRQRVAYLPTGDAILPSKSTVLESLDFHGRMGPMGPKATRKVIEKIIENLRLEEQQDKLISELTLTEKARTRVAIALVSRPAALLLDSPLLALDVYEAFQTISVLKQVAEDLNIAVLISVNQPSSEVLFAMVQVVFISKGSVLFAGPPDEIVPYFAQLGYACPPSYSPSDFLLFLFEVVSAEEHDRLSSSWLWTVGNEFKLVENTLMESKPTLNKLPSVDEDENEAPYVTISQEMTLPFSGANESALPEEPSKTHESHKDGARGRFFSDRKTREYNKAGFWVQFNLLSRRELIYISRNWEAALVRFALVSVLCILIALMMYQIGSNAQRALAETSDMMQEENIQSHVTNYYGAISVMVILAIFGQVEGVSVTIPSVRRLFMAEHSFADLYGSFVFFLVMFLMELPLALLNSVIQVSAAYWIVGFTGNFVNWIAIVFCSALATSSVGWLVSSTAPSPFTALRLIPVVLLPQLLFSGLLTDVELIPAWLNWMEYLCFLKCCINLAFLVEMKEYLNMEHVPHAIQFIADQNSIHKEQTWLYLSIVVIIILGCRIVAAVVLNRYKTAQFFKL